MRPQRNEKVGMNMRQRNSLWVTACVLSLILGIIALSYVGYAFRMVTGVFLILWILVPCMAWVMNDDRVAVLFSTASLKRMRTCFMVISITISFLFFAQLDHLRDRFGQAHIDGYSVQHRPDYDDFGRSCASADVSTENWYAKVGLWFGELILLVLCVGIPVLTWKGTTEAIERRQEASQYPRYPGTV